MNQDQVKELLLKLDNKVEDFTVTFSGKESRKVDGLYYPDRMEIIIHNKNFSEDNQLIYTAIHEFAHHVHFTTSPVPVTSRSHTNQFWNILHNLLYDAEEKGIYQNVFDKNDQFIKLTQQIKDKFMTVNGELMKEFGRLLHSAFTLCQEHHASFDDYVERKLLIHRTVAKTLMKVHAMDINPEIGYDNMKTVASIRDDSMRQMAEEAFLEGKSPEMVKTEFSEKKPPHDPLEQLLGERDRIERSIDNMTVKLAKIERKISELKNVI